jgi:GNAT superfamily N-acetyltransferase
MDRAGEKVRVERATLAEVDAAYAIVAEYYEALRVVAREACEDFRKEYFGPTSGLWLAWLGSHLAGCIALREMSPGGAAEIKRMYVREAYRGFGIARKLLTEAESFARSNGYRRIFLDSTERMQAAVRLYQRAGYRPCERYNQNPEATVFMCKDLDQLAPASPAAGNDNMWPTR